MKHWAGMLLLLLLPLLTAGCHGGAHRPAQYPAVPLTGTGWRLVAIEGHALSPAVDGRREPSLLLSSADSRVQGYTGCNMLSGSFAVQDGQRLRFTQLVTTKMACIEPTPEAEFLQALQQVEHYTLSGTTLHLHKARMAPLLTFEANEAP